jgi:hypothetical protein
LLVVLSHTSADVENTCPLDGKKFTARLDMSGTTFGKQLDLKPTGATAAPWAVAVCPSDHFALYKKDFTAQVVALELERRTERWEDAEKRAAALGKEQLPEGHASCSPSRRS